MADGTLTISAGDDGIHADAEARIEGGTIDITKSYEGIEALSIIVSGGDIDLAASDDGFNAAGGSTQGSSTFGDDDWSGGQGGFPGGGGFSDGGSNGSIEISGGNVSITAGGDGVDSNGSVEISGGYTVVTGPTSGDTAVLDYNSTGVITGGTFIGTGGAGMAQGFSSVSGQGLIEVSVGSQSAGTTVQLTDANGAVIAEVTPDLDYAVVYISTPDMAQGNTYTLTAGTYSETIDLTEAMYSSLAGGRGGSLGGMGPRQGMNGQNGMQGRGHGGHGQMRDGGNMPDVQGRPDANTGASQLPDDNSDEMLITFLNNEVLVIIFI